MAGHSKWANIKHRKERVDNKRGKAFSRVVKEIYVSVKLGGPEPNSNPRLRLALQKAKEVNLPKANIDKAINKGSGKSDDATYEELRYEGYGPAGVAVIVDCLTDNKNRTTSEVRHAFTKNGGTLGTDGSVSYMFERVGQLLYAPGCDKEKIINLGIEAGASDFVEEEDGSVELVVDAGDFVKVLSYMEEKEASPDSAEVTMKAQTSISLADDAASKVQKLLDALDDCEDTQEIYSNAQLLA